MRFLFVVTQDPFSSGNTVWTECQALILPCHMKPRPLNRSVVCMHAHIPDPSLHLFCRTLRT